MLESQGVTWAAAQSRRGLPETEASRRRRHMLIKSLVRSHIEPRRRTLKHLRIFLSHAAGDQPFADALACAIQRGGADVQIVAHSEDSEKGEYTGAPTEEILRDVWVRPIFVVILSTEALASTWIRYECQWAIRCYRRDAGRIILPVVARPIDHLDEGAMVAP